MVVSARNALESAGFSVQRGILGITPLKRLLKKGAEPVSDAHRLAALQLACDAMCEVDGPAGWLVPDGRGMEYGSGSQFVRGLHAELTAEAPGAVLFKLIGADTAVRYPNELLTPTVVVCRQGSTPELHRVIEERRLAGRPDLILTDELPGEECSSTKLREALSRQDAAAVRSMCFDPVAEYLLANRGRLYVTVEQMEGQASWRGGKGADRHAGKGSGKGRGGYKANARGGPADRRPSQRSHETAGPGPELPSDVVTPSEEKPRKGRMR